MAEQTTAQQDDEHMVNTILTNAGTVVCFKSNSLADEQRLLHVFNGLVESGEISNLPSYHFYVKLSGGLTPQDPTSGMTLLLGDNGDAGVAEAVVAASRRNYAVEWQTVEQAQAKMKAERETAAAAGAAKRKSHTTSKQPQTNAAKGADAQSKSKTKPNSKAGTASKPATASSNSRERLKAKHRRMS
jgi:hypothetical protein